MEIKRYNDNIFYNIGFVKGKVDTLGYFDFKKDKNEIIKIYHDINETLELIYKQVCELSLKNKKIEVPNLNTRYF